MSEIKLTEEDIKLCELYQKTKDQNLILKFYNKFANDICNIIFYKVNSKFYSIPFEKDDLMHIIWKACKRYFKQYDKNNKNQTINYFILMTYQDTLREIRKFLTNGERIMNNVRSYEEDLINNRNFQIKSDNIVYVKKEYNEVYQEISQFIIENISKLNKNDVKKVIYLKSLGYSNIEIEKKLNFSRSYVRRIVLTIKKIGEKY